jgi:hypothetical protein
MSANEENKACRGATWFELYQIGPFFVFERVVYQDLLRRCEMWKVLRLYGLDLALQRGVMGHPRPFRASIHRRTAR